MSTRLSSSVLKRGIGSGRSDILPESKKLKIDAVSFENDTFITDICMKRNKCASCVSDFGFNKERVKLLSTSNDISENSRGILYWMSRDQRVQGRTM